MYNMYNLLTLYQVKSRSANYSVTAISLLSHINCHEPEAFQSIMLHYGIIVLYYGIIVLHYGIIVLYYGIIMNFYTFPVYIQEVKPVMKNGCQLFYGPTTSGILKRCTRIW